MFAKGILELFDFKKPPAFSEMLKKYKFKEKANKRHHRRNKGK